MKLRLHRLADQPPPKYNATGHNVTVRFHHGGKLITKPSAEYVGGTVSVYDYAPVKSLCIDILNEMCEEVTPNELVIEPHPHNEPVIEDWSDDVYRTVDDYVDEYVSGNRDKADVFHESDYLMNDEDDGVEENPQRVDATKGGEVPGCNESSSDDYSKEDMVYNGDDFDSGVESNEEEILKFPTFDISDKYKATFEIGMYFSTKKHFRDVVNSHAVITKRNLKLAKNDTRRIYAKCLGKGCDWRINVLKELRISNPGSTAILVMEDRVDEGGRKKFAKLYICFDALKQGFMAGCRPIVGVDGCHLKGPHGGILLTVVAIDPNNCLYPLAYAVVSNETRQNWEWFLTLLKEDLNMVRDDAYTFISDKQKGLISAFHNVLPGVDNRYCVRHLSGNMKTSGGFKGLAYKHALWNASLATTIPDFEVRMKEMGELDERVGVSFNSSILEAREKPVITMLEWIREYLMTRLSENRDRATRRWGNKKVCPNIRKIIDKNMERAGDCIAIKSNNWNYEVSCFYDSSRVYQHAILPVNGQRLWPKTGYIPPLPPNFGRRAGRPSSARRMEPDEPRAKGKKQRGKKPVTLGKQKYKVKCHYCGEQGHNQKGCGKKREDMETTSATSASGFHVSTTRWSPKRKTMKKSTAVGKQKGSKDAMTDRRLSDLACDEER
ncbi:hypothetical protein BUALT_Bualt07G0078100 [Buddleja alternifolia]|uniref:CCHC-type domain-containing protein n=1 Tax=Buddleja alternifolia TaxID=168488 RepID=A0AAV6XGS7_9LAMI|nr:hypothetical protein BUALT_Bualt07G0078100 [Buddleja alternifolia]